VNPTANNQLNGPSPAPESVPTAKPQEGREPAVHGIAKFLLAAWNRNWLPGLLLVIATFMVYHPAWHGDFIWDDGVHISDNGALRSLDGLWAIWFKPGATCQYYPLTFTGFWIGYQLWGLNPLGYHLLNVLLQALAAVLLWQVLARLKVRGAWLAGAIFALHPVCVMSVAWMTELKNTLSASLALGAGWAYLRFAGLGVYERAGEANIEHPMIQATPTERCASRCWRFYVLSLGLFQLALFAKTAVSFLPVTLLLVTWWQRERLRWRDVWPLLPMLGMAGVIGRLTFDIEHLYGATGEQFNLGILERMLVSGRSFWFYLGKLFFPHQLTFIYERWQPNAGVWWQYLYPLATVGVLGWVWWQRRRLGKGLFAALLHFYVSTSLLIFLVVLYMTRYSFVSDHWQYFGCMSILAAAAAGITAVLERFEKGRPFPKPALCGLLLLGLGVLTWRQCGMYANIETLWKTTLTRNPDSFMAHNNFGKVLLQKGQADEAILHFQKSLKIQSDNVAAHDNLGSALLQTGRVEEAIACFLKALELQPGFVEARYNLGNALLRRGQVDEAIDQYQKVVESQPDYVEARYNLGNTLLRRGRVDEAIDQYQKALDTQPDLAEIHNNLGNALVLTGRVDEALAHFQKALALKPDFVEAHNNLANALLRRGRAQEALAHYQRSLEIQPDNVRTLSNLAWVLATHRDAGYRNAAEAVRLAERLCELTGRQRAEALEVLAAAYAEAGRFDEAIQSAQQAHGLAETAGQTNLAQQMQAQLKLYQTNRPYRE
jgi:tetratricopeptide (TPR) repeat protein